DVDLRRQVHVVQAAHDIGALVAHGGAAAAVQQQRSAAPNTGSGSAAPNTQPPRRALVGSSNIRV
ncbi:hypothetical protein TSOC_015279, partial [Tetrabaena socialis]